MSGYRLRVYKKDRRTKTGERFFKSFDFPYMRPEWVEGEMVELRHIYPASEGWRLDMYPRTVVVKNLMTGEPVEIDYELRGGPCDPSMERYWSM